MTSAPMPLANSSPRTKAYSPKCWNGLAIRTSGSGGHLLYAFVPNRTNRYQVIDPFLVSDALICDGHDLVRKGYGWMLKVLSLRQPGEVYDYLLAKSGVMPRVAFGYALERLSPQMKESLMRG